MIHDALEYADKGYKVFPCNGKQPLTPHGCKDATSDTAQIEKWITDFPDCNWAIATAGLLVVDCDPGSEAWPEGFDHALDLAAAPTVITPRGGRHFYFRQDGTNYGNTAGKLFAHVDTRGNGGYVMAQPSANDGKPYKWLTGSLEHAPHELPLPPAWLLNLLSEKPQKAATSSAAGPIRKIPDGQRNDALYSFGCKMRRFGHTAAEILGALAARNLERCEPPLEEHEIATIARSAAEHEPAVNESSDGAPRGKPTTKPIIRNIADVKAETTEWLWKDRIAIGELCVIGGYQGLGKSFLTLDIASRVSKGTPWPDGAPNVVGSAVLLSAEDDLSRTIKPRLIAAGADCSRISAIQGVQFENDGSEGEFNLERDLPALEQAIKASPNCKLVVIDPVQSYMGGVDDNQGKDVRDILGPLRRLAEDHRVAVLYVTHLNRRETTNALDRIGGSGAYTQVPRVAWIVAKDKSDENGRLFVQLKNNLAPNPGGLSFRIIDKAVKWDDRPISTTADEALAADRKKGGSGPTLLALASTWLSNFLASGPKPVAEIEEAAEAEPISNATLYRAKAAIGAQSKPVRTESGSHWEWFLPGYVICAGGTTPDAQSVELVSA